MSVEAAITGAAAGLAGAFVAAIVILAYLRDTELRLWERLGWLQYSLNELLRRTPRLGTWKDDERP